MLDLKWKPAAREEIPRTARRAVPLAHKRPDYVRIARELSTASQIMGAVRGERSLARAGETTEERLAQIWSELLQKPDFAGSDNFFDLGGHSLLAVMLIGRVREAFGVELGIDDVYSVNLTLGELAGKIDAYQNGDSTEYEALYKEIEALSDDEVKQLLAAEDPGVSLP